MLRAVLFDFDGVLADTEPLHLRMFQKVLETEGIELTSEEYFSDFLGLSDRDCLRAVFERDNRALTPEKEKRLIALKNEGWLNLVSGESIVYPGVEEALVSLQRRYYMAVVSGALKAEIEVVLMEAGLRGFFPVVIGAEDVSKGKPDPEGFFLAMKLLNMDHVPEADMLIPGECMVVEDSPWGIEAARRAGMKSAAIRNTYSRENLKGADWIISNLSEVEKLLRFGVKKNRSISS